jgi:hypothetical protein
MRGFTGGQHDHHRASCSRHRQTLRRTRLDVGRSYPTGLLYLIQAAGPNHPPWMRTRWPTGRTLRATPALSLVGRGRSEGGRRAVAAGANHAYSTLPAAPSRIS